MWRKRRRLMQVHINLISIHILASCYYIIKFSFLDSFFFFLFQFFSIPLPPWVLEEISKNPDLVYTDRSGRRNPEYISLGCDNLPVLRGRTPLQVYSDFMTSFRDRFRDYLGSVIQVNTVQQINLMLNKKLRF